MSSQKIELPRYLFFLNAGIGIVSSFALYQFVGRGLDAISFGSGFFLFLVNALIIASLSGTLIKVSLGGGESAAGYAKKAGIFLGILKVVGLFAALYVALIYFALPPTFFALGSFAALISVVSSFAIDYLKRLGNGAQTSSNKG